MSAKPAAPAAASTKGPAPPAQPAAAPPAQQQPQQQARPNDGRLRIELTQSQRQELRQAFDLFDSEGTGRIPASEIKVALRALGFEVRKEELKALLADVGANASSLLDFNEFLAVLLLKMGEKETKEEVTRAYKLFDDTNRGYVSFDDLKATSHDLGYALTDDELREMLDFAHPRGRQARDNSSGPAKDPQITEDDFMRLMKRANVY